MLEVLRLGGNVVAGRDELDEDLLKEELPVLREGCDLSILSILVLLRVTVSRVLLCLVVKSLALLF